MFPLLIERCFSNDELVNVYAVHITLYLLVIVFLLYLSASISGRAYAKLKSILIVGNHRGISILSGLIVSFGIGFFIFMVIATGDLNYMTRHQVFTGYRIADDLTEYIAEYYKAHNNKPEKHEILSWIDERYSERKYVSNINIDDDFRVIITYKSEGVAEPIQNKTLIFSPEYKNRMLEWNCKSGTLPLVCRPSGCK